MRGVVLLLDALLTIIRDKTTPRSDFIFYSDRIIRLLVEEGSFAFTFQRRLPLLIASLLQDSTISRRMKSLFKRRREWNTAASRSKAASAEFRSSELAKRWKLGCVNAVEVSESERFSFREMKRLPSRSSVSGNFGEQRSKGG